MHPDILSQVAKAHTDDLIRQANRYRRVDGMVGQTRPRLPRSLSLLLSLWRSSRRQHHQQPVNQLRAAPHDA